jgi:hypothetical protein
VTHNFPSIYHLVIDPKEEDSLETATLNTWVEAPLAQVVEDHKASLGIVSGIRQQYIGTGFHGVRLQGADVMASFDRIPP